MTRSRLIAVTLVLSSAATTAVPPATGPQQAFRTRVDAVAVDVAVTNGNTPVTGLAAQDFALLDNGVSQKVELLSTDRLPIDVTLVVDTSGSMARVLDRVKESLRRVAAMLRPDDRLRVLSFATATREVLALGEPVDSLHVDALHVLGNTAVNDALVQALVLSRDPERRHLVAAFTDGFDNYSVVAPEHVLDVARRADSVFVVALWPAASMKGPFRPPASQEALLRKTTEATGGQLYEGSSPDAIDRTFRRIFDAYRQSYVLRYEPTGVAREGWHEISVRVVKAGGGRYTVRARKGYAGS